MDLVIDALEYRRRHQGLIGVESKVPVKDRGTLRVGHLQDVRRHRRGADVPAGPS